MQDQKAKICELLRNLTDGDLDNKIKENIPKQIKIEDMEYKKFNELLLTFGLDTVTNEFFDWIFKKKITDIYDLKNKIDTFRKIALLKYGNIKYAFKSLSKKDIIPCDYKDCLKSRHTTLYTGRPKPLHELELIKPEQSYYNGYLWDDENISRTESNPNKNRLAKMKKERDKIRKKGKNNHDVYLTYDFMDVYIATSMREKFEFYMVGKFIQKLKYIMEEKYKLRGIRYFDPTQAYCEDRIDKGLVEGLMLKRAECTIYLAQESDTLGKDSELATTLAQGKPVIAFIPDFDNDNFRKLITEEIPRKLYNRKRQKITRELLAKYCSKKEDWQDKEIIKIMNGKIFDENKASNKLYNKAKELYDSRYNMLKKTHPLALQINLNNGVANGVLVVRNFRECAELLKNILLNKMEFELREAGRNNSLELIEKISECVHRVMTSDKLLTNSFWNLYFTKMKNVTEKARDLGEEM